MTEIAERFRQAKQRFPLFPLFLWDLKQEKTMAQLTYGVIRGEQAFDAYCQRRWKQWARFCESFAHIENVTVERFYEKSPTDDGYTEYFLMTMPTNRDTGLCWHNDIATMVKREIREGTIKLLSV